MSIPVILLVVLVFWLILGSLAKVAEVIFWIVVIVLLVSAGVAAYRHLKNKTV